MISNARKINRRKRLLYSPVNAYGARKAIHSPGSLVPTLHLPFYDLGSGQADIRPSIGNVSGIFSRSSTAWTRISDGRWVEVAAGIPRSYYNSSLTYCGVLVERGITNRCLWSRDLTNAVWVALNVTPTKTAIGIDAVADSGSTLTSAAPGATIFQTVVNASSIKTFSFWVKRRTGTGTISITIDGGLSSTNITSLINDNTYVRVSVTQTLANPVFGFIFASSGDAIDVDMGQLENFLSPSTPYPATASPSTRIVDILTYATTSWFNASEGSFFSRSTALHLESSGNAAQSFDNGTSAERIFTYQNGSPRVTMFCVDGGATQVNSPSTITPIVDTPFRAAMAYKINDFAMSANGIPVVTDQAGTLPEVTALRVNYSTTGGQVSAATRDFRYFPSRIPNTMLQAIALQQ